MKLQLALPASALLVAFSAAAWIHAPKPRASSPRSLVARAGIGAISAIASAGKAKLTPEATESAAPLTLSASRPDEVAPADGASDISAIEHYHEQAIVSARARTATVVVDPNSGRLPRASVVVEFERKCERSADGTPKPECTSSALELPIVGCYLQQAAAAMLG
ncbi:MAG: hypothetical protein HYU52_14970 [Acidobacteria bacterium]|nr:hypothetical protein [Acidobacteriota bacterium]